MKRITLACAGAALALTAVAGSGPPAHAATKKIARADWSAGPVGSGAGYARQGGSRRVREVQRRLARLGHRPGPVDGLFGPRTRRAALTFQRSSRLPADGIVGRRTLRALRAREAERSGDTRREAEPPPTETPPVGAPASPPEARPAAITLVDAAPRTATDPGSPIPRIAWVAAVLLATLAGIGLLARGAGRHAAPEVEARPDRTTVAAVPSRELAAQAEHNLSPRFTRPAADGVERRSLAPWRRGSN